MNTRAAFARSLKPMPIEEFFDYYFYRRIAHRLIPVLARLKLSPNQVTGLSLIFGLAASFAVLNRFFSAAAVLAVTAVVFDCCDGQLARLTGQTSPLGRVLDGVFDLTWVTCFWFGIFFSGALQNDGFPRILSLMIPSSLSMIVHCWRFDGIKLKAAELYGEGNRDNDVDADESWRVWTGHLRRLNLLMAVLIFCQWFQVYFFVRGNRKKTSLKPDAVSAARIKGALDPVLDDCSWIGEGHHNTLVILGVLLMPLSPWGLVTAFWIILVPMNVWWLKCEFEFVRAVKSVRPLWGDGLS